MYNKTDDELNSILDWCARSADRRRAVLEVTDSTLTCINEYKSDALAEKIRRATATIHKEKQ